MMCSRDLLLFEQALQKMHRTKLMLPSNYLPSTTFEVVTTIDPDFDTGLEIRQ
jgi:hypothetical protein